MTAKQSKRQELDLLQAVEEIVELAKDSHLSKDFFRKPRPYKGTKCNDVTIY